LSLINALSLYWRTEFIFAQFDSVIDVHANYIIVRTPNNPQFYWGNFLLIDHAPASNQWPQWLALFKQAITEVQPMSQHIAIGFNHATQAKVALPQTLQEQGWQQDTLATLVLNTSDLRLQAGILPTEYIFKLLNLADDEKALAELKCRNNDDGYEIEVYRNYLARRLARDARMSAAGQGGWYGVFTRDSHELIACCGLFNGTGDDATLGRFQYVLVDKPYRRQGLCKAMVARVVADGFDARGLQTQVIAAYPKEAAIRIYRSLGFRDVNQIFTWQLRAPQDRKPAL
jgi:RimJ/RimL family protein N-acetyltransferase